MLPFHGAGFADDGDFDRARVLHVLFDFVGHVFGDEVGAVIVYSGDSWVVRNPCYTTNRTFSFSHMYSGLSPGRDTAGRMLRAYRSRFLGKSIFSRPEISERTTTKATPHQMDLMVRMPSVCWLTQ